MKSPRVSLAKPLAGRSPHRLIMREGVCVGELEVDRFWRRSRESMVEEFGASPSRVFPLLDRLGVPDVLNVTWVFDLRVPAALRGQGIAREALACLFSKTPGLILLQLGPATGARMSQEKRREIYRRLGFSLKETRMSTVRPHAARGAFGRRRGMPRCSCALTPSRQRGFHPGAVQGLTPARSSRRGRFTGRFCLFRLETEAAV